MTATPHEQVTSPWITNAVCSLNISMSSILSTKTDKTITIKMQNLLLDMV